jgi:acetyltransferase-like isoleucine patch superfamily enzyme
MGFSMNRIFQYIFSLFSSSIRVFYLRIRGAQIGKRVLIGRTKFKTKAKNIFIGDGVVIGDGVIFDKLKSIEIKDFVKIHNDVHVENSGDGNARFSILYNSWVGSETILNCERDIIIESNVGIGCRSQIWTHGYFPSSADGYPSKLGKVVIKEGAWLPPSCIILPNVEVGESSIIGTGSIITKNIPNRVFATGVPCKIQAKEKDYRKMLSPQEKIDCVLAGCIKNIEQKGGKVEHIDKNTWRCSIFYKNFELNRQTPIEHWGWQKDSCIFTWEILENMNHQLSKNTTIFILSNNTYTKQSTLHEWIVIRALLDSCTLRLKPIKLQ